VRKKIKLFTEKKFPTGFWKYVEKALEFCSKERAHDYVKTIFAVGKQQPACKVPKV